jgi:hypothetical protein
MPGQLVDRLLRALPGNGVRRDCEDFVNTDNGIVGPNDIKENTPGRRKRELAVGELGKCSTEGSQRVLVSVGVRKRREPDFNERIHRDFRVMARFTSEFRGERLGHIMKDRRNQWIAQGGTEQKEVYGVENVERMKINKALGR